MKKSKRFLTLDAPVQTRTACVFALPSKVEDALVSPTTAAKSSRLAIQLSAGLLGSFYHLHSALSSEWFIINLCLKLTAKDEKALRYKQRNINLRHLKEQSVKLNCCSAASDGVSFGNTHS